MDGRMGILRIAKLLYKLMVLLDSRVVVENFPVCFGDFVNQVVNRLVERMK
jgi:hypothetical protein